MPEEKEEKLTRGPQPEREEEGFANPFPPQEIIGKFILILIDFRKSYKIATMCVEEGEALRGLMAPTPFILRKDDQTNRTPDPGPAAGAD